jgi:hypothetical protein
MKKAEILAQSKFQKPIEVFDLGNPVEPCFVLIGGMHGDEPEGAQLVLDFIEKAAPVENSFATRALVVPQLNPDGLEKNQRVNGSGVDLNRNFPSLDWAPQFSSPHYYPGPKPGSEPEVVGLVKLLREAKPFLVIHVHTYLPQMNYTGEISKPWAEFLAEGFGHPVTDNIGYPTPGSLGQFCHQVLNTACVCIELPEFVERRKAWDMVGQRLIKLSLSQGVP